MRFPQSLGLHNLKVGLLEWSLRKNKHSWPLYNLEIWLKGSSLCKEWFTQANCVEMFLPFFSYVLVCNRWLS